MEKQLNEVQAQALNTIETDTFTPESLGVDKFHGIEWRTIVKMTFKQFAQYVKEGIPAEQRSQNTKIKIFLYFMIWLQNYILMLNGKFENNKKQSIFGGTVNIVYYYNEAQKTIIKVMDGCHRVILFNSLLDEETFYNLEIKSENELTTNESSLAEIARMFGGKKVKEIENILCEQYNCSINLYEDFFNSFVISQITYTKNPARAGQVFVDANRCTPIRKVEIFNAEIGSEKLGQIIQEFCRSYYNEDMTKFIGIKNIAGGLIDNEVFSQAERQIIYNYPLFRGKVPTSMGYSLALHLAFMQDIREYVAEGGYTEPHGKYYNENSRGFNNNANYANEYDKCMNYVRKTTNTNEFIDFMRLLIEAGKTIYPLLEQFSGAKKMKNKPTLVFFPVFSTLAMLILKKQ